RAARESSYASSAAELVDADAAAETIGLVSGEGDRRSATRRRREGAPRCEAAPECPFAGGGNVARNGRKRVSRRGLLWVREKQGSRVVVERLLEHGFDLTRLDDLARIHNRRASTAVGHNSPVVGDEEDRER